MEFLIGENISAVIQKKMPEKYGDLRLFFIPCVFGKIMIQRVMLDLEASINVMPLSLFNDL